MCFPGRETHIAGDMCSSTREQISPFTCVPLPWKCISLVTRVPPLGKHISIETCVPYQSNTYIPSDMCSPPGKHISLVMRVPLPGKHISLVKENVKMIKGKCENPFEPNICVNKGV